MRNTWKIAIALTLVFCMAVAFIACNDEDEPLYVYVTDSDGEIVTDEAGDPIIETDENGDYVTLPNDEGSDDSGSDTSIHNVGAETNSNFGKIHTPVRG